MPATAPTHHAGSTDDLPLDSRIHPALARRFDPDLHCRIDATAAEHARNAAILAAQELFSEFVGTVRRVEELRRTAHGDPAAGEIVKIAKALNNLRTAWPRALHLLRTDLQKAEAVEINRAFQADVDRHGGGFPDLSGVKPAMAAQGFAGSTDPDTCFQRAPMGGV